VWRKSSKGSRSGLACVTMPFFTIALFHDALLHDALEDHLISVEQGVEEE
jgi:hypothetical protein